MEVVDLADTTVAIMVFTITVAFMGDFSDVDLQCLLLLDYMAVSVRQYMLR